MTLILFAYIITGWYENKIRSVRTSMLILLPTWNTNINDLSDNLTSTVNLLADDTSPFSTVKDPNIFSKELNRHLQLVSEWAYK